MTNQNNLVNVSIFIIDDCDISMEIPRYRSQIEEFNFEVKYYGEIKNAAQKVAKDRYEENRKSIQALSSNDHAIIILDLKIPDYELESKEVAKLREWFGEIINTQELKLDDFIGLFFLVDLLENSDCKKTIVITSQQGELRQYGIDKCLKQYGATEIEDFIVYKGQIIQYGKLLITNKWKQNLEKVLQSFVSRNNEIMWYLNPPDLRGNSSKRWFPIGAHDEDEPDSKVYVNAVKARYPRWEGFEYAKSLVSTDYETTKTTNLVGGIPIYLLKDFFGENLEIDSFVENKKLSWEDKIILPTNPAFSFLISVSKLLKDLQESHSSSPITLRLMCDSKDKYNSEFAVVALGLKTTFSCDKWNLVEATWSKFVLGTGTGITSTLFANAMNAKCLDNNDEAGLKKVLQGVKEGFVAIPFFTKEFIGISWKTRILRKPILTSSQPTMTITKLSKREN